MKNDHLICFSFIDIFNIILFFTIRFKLAIAFFTNNAFKSGNNNTGNAPVRVSFLSLRPTTSNCRNSEENDILVNGDISSLQRRFSETSNIRDLSNSVDNDSYYDRICFNIGRELYIFQYR